MAYNEDYFNTPDYYMPPQDPPPYEPPRPEDVERWEAYNRWAVPRFEAQQRIPEWGAPPTTYQPDVRDWLTRIQSPTDIPALSHAYPTRELERGRYEGQRIGPVVPGAPPPLPVYQTSHDFWALKPQPQLGLAGPWKKWEDIERPFQAPQVPYSTPQQYAAMSAAREGMYKAPAQPPPPAPPSPPPGEPVITDVTPPKPGTQRPRYGIWTGEPQDRGRIMDWLPQGAKGEYTYERDAQANLINALMQRAPQIGDRQITLAEAGELGQQVMYYMFKKYVADGKLPNQTVFTDPKDLNDLIEAALAAKPEMREPPEAWVKAVAAGAYRTPPMPKVNYAAPVPPTATPGGTPGGGRMVPSPIGRYNLGAQGEGAPTRSPYTVPVTTPTTSPVGYTPPLGAPIPGGLAANNTWREEERERRDREAVPPDVYRGPRWLQASEYINAIRSGRWTLKEAEKYAKETLGMDDATWKKSVFDPLHKEYRSNMLNGYASWTPGYQKLTESFFKETLGYSDKEWKVMVAQATAKKAERTYGPEGSVEGPRGVLSKGITRI